MRLAALTVSCLALVAALPALAAEMPATSKIDAVIVYPEAAAVTRVANIDLPAGATTLVFKGLPIDLDPASLRVEGEAPGKLTIGSVETRVAPAEANPDTTLDARIKSLRSEREALQVAIEALQGKKAMILRFAQTGPEKLAADGKPLDIVQWDAAWEAVGAALTKVGDELRSTQAKARDLDEEIRGLEDSRQQPVAKTGPARDVTVALETDAALEAVVKLTYRVAGASWQPLYDARLDTGSQSKQASLELVRRAAVAQRTGEAWDDVSLSVSTVSTNRGTAVPDIQPKQIAFAEPPAAFDAAPSLGGGFRKEAGRERDALKAPPPPLGMPMAERPASVPEAKAAAEIKSTLDAGAYEASFRVPGRITVPSDGSQKSFLLGSQTLSPSLVVKTVPALDPTAYLDAGIANEGDAPLLPGQVSLLRDGTFVGVGQIGLVAPGDNLELGFGADDRVKVARVPVKRKENDPYWIGTNKTEADEFKTTVKNLHDFPIKVGIIDRIPFSETTTIVVEQLPATTPPTEKMIGDKRGVMGWTYVVQPNETKEVHLAYRMRWPADREVVFEDAPLALR